MNRFEELMSRAVPNYNTKLYMIRTMQKGESFFIGKMKTSDLLKISRVTVKDDKENAKKYIEDTVKSLKYDFKSQQDSIIKYRASDNEVQGVQRLVQISRLEAIAKYLSQTYALFPNTILASLCNKKFSEIYSEKELNEIKLFLNDNSNNIESNIIKEEIDKIKNSLDLNEIDITDIEDLEVKSYSIEKCILGDSDDIYIIKYDSRLVNADIIDGQHRLASFTIARNYIDQFELPVTLFFNLMIFKQAELFSTINGEQKPVNKSLIYDLYNLRDNGDGKFNDIKRCVMLSSAFNKAKNSPLNNKIKMTGSGDGTLSQAAFVDELIQYIKQRNRHPYKSFLRDKDDETVMTILLKYFRSLQKFYPEAWNNTKDYLLLRTTGYGIVMKILYYVYMDLYLIYKDIDKINFDDTISKLKSITSFSNKEFQGGSSQGIQNNKKNQILRSLFLTGVDESKYILDIEYRKSIDNDLKEYLLTMEKEYKEALKR